jgi:hypothetical protein
VIDVYRSSYGNTDLIFKGIYTVLNTIAISSVQITVAESISIDTSKLTNKSQRLL